ncbi:peptide/nickel transport system permease protein [Devosia sp. YR412]|uniref:ABC transporter permease n=1 Tax=Devosia sp. YR412 TaxID=1881030 RepID=UPI0008B508C1|nr:ABC transporter permease [Devosia sp. YR412]SEP64134.1 peptide/nickel transport system permease protein [Devosia sp. YR412]
MTELTATIAPTLAPTRKGKPSLFATLWSRANLFTRINLGAFALVLIVAATAHWIAPFDPDAQKLLARLKPPMGFAGANGTNILGTDQLGRDLLSRTLHGLQLTMAIALIGSLISLVLGTTLGVVAGYARGWFGGFIMAVVDIQLAIPFTLIALVVIAVFGNSLPVLIITIGLAGWEVYARIVRAQVLATSRMPFVEAAVAAGAKHDRILFKHILPNIVSPIIVVWTMTFSALILAESSLSFLGLGVQPPTATLGSMVGLGRDYLASTPWIALVPAIAIMFVSLQVLLIGDWLRDALDIRLK